MITEHVNLYKGYGVTLIVEGGHNTLELLENDLKHKRPIILIQVCILYVSIFL